MVGKGRGLEQTLKESTYNPKAYGNRSTLH